MKLMWIASAILILGIGFWLVDSLAYKPPEYVKMANRITANVSEQIKNETGLVPIGTGGSMMHDIQMLALSFQYYHAVDQNQARDLLLYCVDTYVNAVNSNVDVRPFLHDYPFTSKNIQIRIWVYASDATRMPLGEISSMSSIDGIFKYISEDPATNHYEVLYRESYEEAQSIVEARKNNPS
ncbi:MAG: hypothetical protein JSS61_07250 [Verrucomicrobia bacterium]|nr:hypothetical protein [Verrucomicrobiota bacterium]